MSSESVDHPRVVPAHLGFLAIYNPSFGSTDETARDQIVYYFSSQRPKRKDEGVEDANSEEVDNERLRQVGLARGMVQFAKNFSNDTPVESVETQRKRIIMHELEPGWWILASVNLTQLPALRTSPNEKSSVDYSSREVSPPQLLSKQLQQAHSVFLLHHAATLHDIYQRLGRIEFCSLLDRYWTEFVKSWDVLLHGNPAVDIYRGIKLAAGGELGIGVGEEDWGSGEREVLEDFVSRTEGLVDVVVSRFGDAPIESENQDSTDNKKSKQFLPWLGTGEDPRSSDGVIFSGTGALSRYSVTAVSQWIEAIFKYGERGYGVGENPSSRRGRKRRKLSPKAERNKSGAKDHTPISIHESTPSQEKRSSDLRRRAIENRASSPRIPPPLVGVGSAQDMSPASNNPKMTQEQTSRQPHTEESNQNYLSGTDKMMKYLSLGYGTSWTLNPKGLNPKSHKEADSKEHSGTKSSKDGKGNTRATVDTSPDVNKPSLQELDPMPESSDDEESIFVQRLEQSVGKFIIGLLGDLENTEFEEVEVELADGAKPRSQPAQRIVLRTLTVEMSRPQEPSISRCAPSLDSTRNSMDTMNSRPEGSHTSAGASVDGAQPIVHHKKVQVAVYVHQPFIFAFFFDLHTSNLSMPAFYRNLHHQLGPLQKPLLKSTDPSRIAERIAEAMGERTSTTSPATNSSMSEVIYDIIFDPTKKTVRTSIPNIPVPRSLAAEGLTSSASSITVSGSWYTLGIPISSSDPAITKQTSTHVQSPWTRIDALNVHTQILSSWAATLEGSNLELTVKTGRAWWVLWMKVPSENAQTKEAFLVRKAADHKMATSTSRNSRISGGKWLLREQQRDVSGSSTAPGQTTTTASVSEGVGVDARKWIEGLLHLNT